MPAVPMAAARIGRQLRLVPALLVPTARAVGWGPPLAGFGISIGLLALAVRPGLDTPPDLIILFLRLATVVAVLGCAFLLDDSSEPSTEAVAGSLTLRRALRVALLLPATAGWWAAALWRVREVHPGLPLPVAALTLEAASLLAITLAAAAVGSRLAPERRGGVVAAPTLLAMTLAASVLPAELGLYPQPATVTWEAAHQRWAALLGIALVAFAIASRDPARRRLPSRIRARAGRLAGRRPGAAPRPAVQRVEQNTTRSAS